MKDYHIKEIKVTDNNVVVSFSVYELTNKTFQTRNFQTLEVEESEGVERVLLYSDTLSFGKDKAIEIASSLVPEAEVEKIRTINFEESGDLFYPILEQYLKTTY